MIAATERISEMQTQKIKEFIGDSAKRGNVYKLGASPQLEWWNAGILEKWVLGYCKIG
jgi:hypothetical protein